MRKVPPYTGPAVVGSVVGAVVVSVGGGAVVSVGGGPVVSVGGGAVVSVGGGAVVVSSGSPQLPRKRLTIKTVMTNAIMKRFISIHPPY